MWSWITGRASRSLYCDHTIISNHKSKLYRRQLRRRSEASRVEKPMEQDVAIFFGTQLNTVNFRQGRISAQNFNSVPNSSKMWTFVQNVVFLEANFATRKIIQQAKISRGRWGSCHCHDAAMVRLTAVREKSIFWSKFACNS